MTKQTSRLWKALQYDIRAEASVDSLKETIKTLLFDGTYYLKKCAYPYQMWAELMNLGTSVRGVLGRGMQYKSR